MKFTNVAIVMTDAVTGKPYARTLTAFETNLVLAQLQALDDGQLKAREIEPFILRSVGVSEERAKRIAEKQEGLHLAGRQGVQGLIDMADNARTTKTTGRISGPPQQLPKTKTDCVHEWISSEGRTDSGFLCNKCGDYEGPSCPHGVYGGIGQSRKCLLCGSVVPQQR